MFFAYVKQSVLKRKLKNLEEISPADATFPVAVIPVFVLFWLPGLAVLAIGALGYGMVKGVHSALNWAKKLPEKLILRGVTREMLEQHKAKLRWKGRYDIDPSTIDFAIFEYVEPFRDPLPGIFPGHAQYFRIRDSIWCSASPLELRESYNRIALIRWEKNPQPKNATLEES